MKRFHLSFIAVVAAVLLTGSLALADNIANVNQNNSKYNQTEVEQLGNSNEAHVDQSGSNNNLASVYQENRTGAHQKATIHQRGGGSSWNSAQIDQIISPGSTALIDQDYSRESVAYIGQNDVQYTDAEIVQNGGNHMASIHQSSLNGNYGDNSSAKIHQYGWFQSGKITQIASKGTDATIIQRGDYHKAEIIQYDADYSSARIRQSGVVGPGRGNKAKITQTYVDYSDAYIDQWGGRNRAWINQFDGEKMYAYVTQKGWDNKATVHQTGWGHTTYVDQDPCNWCNAVVYQTGYGGHYADVDQAGSQLTALVAQTGNFHNSATVSQVNGDHNLAIVIQGAGAPDAIGPLGGPWGEGHEWKNSMPMNPDMPWIPFNREIRDPKGANWKTNPYRPGTVFPGSGVFLGPSGS